MKDFQTAAHVPDRSTRTGIETRVTLEDSQPLDAIIATRSSRQKHVWRARIILLTARGEDAQAIMTATGESKTCVRRWQERFMGKGVDGLLRQEPSTGHCPSEAKLVEKVVTLEPSMHESTHRTVRAMAKAVDIAASSVVKIWNEHGLAPHRWRRFKLPNDKA